MRIRSRERGGGGGLGGGGGWVCERERERAHWGVCAHRQMHPAVVHWFPAVLWWDELFRLPPKVLLCIIHLREEQNVGEKKGSMMWVTWHKQRRYLSAFYFWGQFTCRFTRTASEIWNSYFSSGTKFDSEWRQETRDPEDVQTAMQMFDNLESVHGARV